MINLMILIGTTIISILLMIYIIVKKQAKFVSIFAIILILVTYILYYLTGLFNNIVIELHYYTNLDTYILLLFCVQLLLIVISFAGFIKKFIVKSNALLKVLYLFNALIASAYLALSVVILTNYRYIILIIDAREYNTNNDFAYINPYIRFISDNIIYVLLFGLALLVLTVIISILEFSKNDNTKKEVQEEEDIIIVNSSQESYDIQVENLIANQHPNKRTKRRQNKNLDYILIDDDIEPKTTIRKIRYNKDTKDFLKVDITD